MEGSEKRREGMRRNRRGKEYRGKTKVRYLRGRKKGEGRGEEKRGSEERPVRIARVVRLDQLAREEGRKQLARERSRCQWREGYRRRLTEL